MHVENIDTLCFLSDSEMTSEILYPPECLPINAEQPLKELITGLKVSIRVCHFMFRSFYIETKLRSSAMEISLEKGTSDVSVHYINLMLQSKIL